MSEPRLRVLMLCQLFHPLIYGGGEVQFWSLAKALVSRGHEVYVVTQRVSGLKDNEEVCGVKIVRVGTPVRYVGALTTSFLDSLAYFLEACWAGIRIAGAKRINIVHSNTYIPAFAGQLCASLLKMAHVMTVHDVYLAALPWFWPKWSQQRGVGISARALGPLLERTILRLPVDVIHTVSEASKHDLVEMGVQNSIVIVPDCIDPLEYKQDEPLSFNRHQAIYIGRLVFYKNLDVVFRAFSRVIENVPDAQLSIVGEGPMKQSWERMVRQRGLKEHITFHGRVSNEQKIRLLNESAYLILPSLIEGFGIVILEAFACKKPVLASNIEALRELVAEDVDGYLLDASSEEMWATKMILLFTQSARARKLGIMGEKKLTARYSTERVAERMVALYQDCLKN